MLIEMIGEEKQDLITPQKDNRNIHWDVMEIWANMDLTLMKKI